MILEYIILLPIAAAIAILLGSPPRFTALAAAALNLVAGLLAMVRFNTSVGGPFNQYFQLTSSYEILASPKLSLSFGVDGISLILVLMTVLVTVAAVWVSPREDKIEGSAKLYYISSLLISAGALGAFCSTDLFFFYAFHELALIPTFLMIGFFGFGKERVKTAWTITVYLGVGSLILLAGLVALFFQLGGDSFAFADLMNASIQAGESGAAGQWIFLTLVIGFGILVSLFPFHSWAPPAYANAPTPVAMLHAGVLKKFGLYGLIRVALPMLPDAAAHWANLFLILLVGNIIVIGLVTIAQRRLDLTLGYSSVMHMGYAFLGVISLSLVGLTGAVLFLFAHGVSIALLFALLGSLRERTGSLEFDQMTGGLGKLAPAFGLLFGFAAFASIGLPGFANFASEVMVFFGAFDPMTTETGMGPLQWAAVFSIWGVVISAVYMLRAYRNVFMGPAPDGPSDVTDLTAGERAPVLLLLAALILVGFVPSVLLNYLTPTLEALTATLGVG